MWSLCPLSSRCTEALRVFMKKENMTRKITLTTNDISQRQWSTLILELNSMSKTWKRFGVEIKINGRNSERIIKWGNKNNDDKDGSTVSHT